MLFAMDTEGYSRIQRSELLLILSVHTCTIDTELRLVFMFDYPLESVASALNVELFIRVFGNFSL
jgi:hypothetical protein